MSGRLTERPLVFGLALALVVLVLDQVTKILALETLFTDGSIIQVTGFFNLVAVWNPGVSFGLFASASASEYMPYLLSGFALVVVVFLLFWLRKAETSALVIGLAMVIGGALGNVIDRLRFGAVIDFVDWHVGGYHWPAFNIADAGITLGVALLLLDGFTSKPNDGE
jgi:signal peptidase II